VQRACHRLGRAGGGRAHTVLRIPVMATAICFGRRADRRRWYLNSGLTLFNGGSRRTPRSMRC